MTTENTDHAGLKPGGVLIEADYLGMAGGDYAMTVAESDRRTPVFPRPEIINPFPAPVWVAHIPKETIRDICGRIVISRSEPLDMGDGYFVGDDIGYMTDILFERLFAIKIAPGERRQIHIFALDAKP